MPEPVKTALSLAAALLFLWSAVWCIRRVFSPEPAPHYTEPSSRSRCWAAIAGAAFILVLHLIFAVTAHINYPEADFRQAIEWQFYGNTDSRHYLDLSIYGYGTQEAFPEQYLQIVFFPLYPALLHILHFVTRIDAFWLGFAVQLPLFAAATASFYTVIARGALPVDNFGTAVCHGAPPSGALARLRSCLFCRNDGYHLADQRPAVRSGAVLPARCLGAAFAGPPTAHKGCIGNAGCRKRYLHNAISIRLAYLLKKLPVS